MQPQQYPPQYQQQFPPQFPQQPAQQQYAAPPAPTYPPQGYPAPQYPTAPPMPQYPQQPQGYPQGYAQPYTPPSAPAAPLPTGSLDTFYQQPSASGGPSFKFMDANRQPRVGHYYEGFVARPVTDADVRAQTNDAGQVQTYRDGRAKFVLVVPMRVQPSQEFPEGQAGWWVKGQARDELARAMAEAGAPAGPPEAGAFIRVTLVGTRPIPGKNPAYQYRVDYVRPQGAAPVSAAPQPVAQQPMQAPPVQETAPVVHQQPIPNPHVNPDGSAVPWQPAPNMPQQYTPQPVAQAAPAQPAPAPQAAPAPTAAPAGFTEEQAALFAKLTGQQG